MSPGRAGGLARLVLLAAILAAAVLAARYTPLGEYVTREGVGRGVDALRGSTLAPLIFVSVYAAATALAVPGTVLTLAGGALFGVLWGSVFNWIAANLGANLAFLLARSLGREGVIRLVGSRLEKLDRVTRAHGFQGLVTLRLIPLVPFNALNFGCGLTAMRWSTYALATAIGILPGTVVYTFFADALLEGSRQASREALMRVLLAGALLILLTFLPTILKKLKVIKPGSAALAAVLAAWPVLAQEVPDHPPFTEVLSTVVHVPSVDYARLQRERTGLDAYLEALARTDPAALEAAGREARLAFWINAYNACMLRQVVDHYPIRRASSLVTRLRNRVAGRPANSVWQIQGVFTRSFCPVAGSPRSQDEIEHEILRPMGEPRIHFALNCAARSCPPLAPEAYLPETLDEQLEGAVRWFMESPDHFRIDRPTGTILLNRVLDWYGEDFGGEDGLKGFFARRLEASDRAFVEDPTTRVGFFDYDWTLNDVER